MVTTTDSPETGVATIGIPLGSGLDIQERLRRISALTERTIAPSTQAVYNKMSVQYSAWIAEHGLFPDWRTLLLYLEELHTLGRKKSYINNAYHAVRWRYPAIKEEMRENAAADLATNLLRNIRRLDRRPSRQAKPIREKEYLAICEADVGDRVKGLLGLMRDGMLRAAEAVAVTYQDVEADDDGSAVLYIRHSKTDQEGKGSVAYISKRTVDYLLAASIDVVNRTDTDRLFPFQTRHLRRIVDNTACTANLPGCLDPWDVRTGTGGFSGHSPRIGMAMDLMASGFSVLELQVSGRWKSPEMPAYYTRKAAVKGGAIVSWYARQGLR